MLEASVQPDVSLDSVVAEVADEFMERLRRGEKPDVEEYAARHPEAAEVLRKVLASLQLLGLPGSGAGSGTEPSGEDTLSGTLGDFRLLREVGRGGMGVVYEAEQISLGRRVALKVLPFAAALDTKQLQRFKNEAQAAACLHHPHIVPVHGVGCERGVHFYAMQFIEGQTLSAVIQEMRSEPRPVGGGESPTPLPNGRGSVTAVAFLSTEKSIRSPAGCRSVAQLGIQAAEALDYAHRQGIIHRDIKPANLLLDGQSQVWIADFGLAKLQGHGSLTMSGDVVGTLRYMSPEQALGQHAQVDERTDLYSLGATLYELLTLEPAFAGQDREDVLRQITQEEPKPPRRLNPAIPAELETIILKALAKLPEERYATAKELADDLGRFLEDKPIRAKRPTLRQRLKKWTRRHRPVVTTAVVSAVAVLVLAVVALAVSTVLITREQQRTQRVAAELALDRALRHDAQGDAHLALLWTAYGLGLTPDNADDLRTVLRTNLGVWRGQINPCRLVLPHDAEVAHAVFTRDGKTLLTASGRRTSTAVIRRWDAATGRLVESLDCPQGPFLRVLTFSPDGSALLLGYRDGTIRLVSVATATVLWETSRQPGVITTAAFSPDGKLVLTGNSESGEETLGAHPGSVRLWEVASGRQIGPTLEHDRLVWGATFSPNGKTFLTSCGVWTDRREKGVVRFWDTDGKETRAPMVYPCLAHAVAFSPDGQLLLAASADLTSRLWDLATGQPVSPPLQHEGPVRAAAFSPDGALLLTGSFDGTARLWEAATGRALGPPLWHRSLVQTVAFSPDGKFFVTGSQDGTARVGEVRATAPTGVPRQDTRLLPLASSPDRQLLLTRDDDHTVRLRHALTDEEMSAPLRHQSLVIAGAFSRERNTALTLEENSTTRLWDLANGKPIAQLLHKQKDVYAVAISPDGTTLVTGTWNMAVLWDHKGNEVRKLPHDVHGPVFTVAVSPDGKTIGSGGADGAVRLWNALTGEPLHVLGHCSAVFALAFSADSKTLASGSADSTALVWDVATGQPRGAPLPHHGGVRAVAFSPDGTTVLTGSRDGTAQLWDVATSKPLGPPFGHPAPVNRVAFGHDGKTVFTAAGEGDRRLLIRSAEASVWSWRVPVPVTGTAEQLGLWAQVVTGMELSANGGERVLDAADWRKRYDQLEQLGFKGP